MVVNPFDISSVSRETEIPVSQFLVVESCEKITSPGTERVSPIEPRSPTLDGLARVKVSLVEGLGGVFLGARVIRSVILDDLYLHLSSSTKNAIY